MTIALFSDIHANLPALEAFFADVDPRRPDQIFCLGDLVGYMQWMSEPVQNNRVRIGVWVLLFLSIFTLIAWRLNASFWKDIK